jgi:uncharacterized protein YwgA
MTSPEPDARAVILARLVSKAPGRKLGHTAAMKLLYFLQELKGIDLGYDFRLYGYGPYDEDVFGDLGAAIIRGLLREKTVLYPRGYGHEISLGPLAERLRNDLDSSEPDTAQAIDEVVAAFGSLGAAELELRSTILFVDRELKRQRLTASLNAIAAQVRAIKPTFSVSAILERVNEFRARGWLQSVPATEQGNAK